MLAHAQRSLHAVLEAYPLTFAGPWPCEDGREVEIAWSLDHPVAATREANLKAIIAIAEVLARFPAVCLHVRGGAAPWDAQQAPAALATHEPWRSVDPQQGAHTLMALLCEQRARACVRALAAQGVEVRRLRTCADAGPSTTFIELAATVPPPGTAAAESLDTSPPGALNRHEPELAGTVSTGVPAAAAPAGRKGSRSAMSCHIEVGESGGFTVNLGGANGGSDAPSVGATSASKPAARPAAREPPPVSHRWWQTQTHVIVDVSSHEVAAAIDLETTFAPLTVTAATVSRSYSLTLKLLSEIVPHKCKHVVDQVSGTVSLRLRKADPIPWANLERVAAATDVGGGQGEEKAAKTAGTLPPWMATSDEEALLLAAAAAVPAPAGDGPRDAKSKKAKGGALPASSSARRAPLPGPPPTAPETPTSTVKCSVPFTARTGGASALGLLLEADASVNDKVAALLCKPARQVLGVSSGKSQAAGEKSGDADRTVTRLIDSLLLGQRRDPAGDAASALIAATYAAAQGRHGAIEAVVSQLEKEEASIVAEKAAAVLALEAARAEAARVAHAAQDETDEEEDETDDDDSEADEPETPTVGSDGKDTSGDEDESDDDEDEQLDDEEEEALRAFGLRLANRPGAQQPSRPAAVAASRNAAASVRANPLSSASAAQQRMVPSDRVAAGDRAAKKAPQKPMGAPGLPPPRLQAAGSGAPRVASTPAAGAGAGAGGGGSAASHRAVAAGGAPAASSAIPSSAWQRGAPAAAEPSNNDLAGRLARQPSFGEATAGRRGVAQPSQLTGAPSCSRPVPNAAGHVGGALPPASAQVSGNCRSGSVPYAAVAQHQWPSISGHAHSSPAASDGFGLPPPRPAAVSSGGPNGSSNAALLPRPQGTLPLPAASRQNEPHQGGAPPSFDSSLLSLGLPPPRASSAPSAGLPPPAMAVGGDGADGTDGALDQMTMMLAEDMIGDLWGEKDDNSFFSDLPGLPGLPSCAGGPASASTRPPAGSMADALGGLPAVGSARLDADTDPVFDVARGTSQSPSVSSGLPPSAPLVARWPSAPPSTSSLQGGRTAASVAAGLPPPVPAAQRAHSSSAVTSGAAVEPRGVVAAGKQQLPQQPRTGGTAVSKDGKEEIPSQDPTKEWRCKCGTINKAATHLCASRSCHCYFCLACGQLGHQQRFCRRVPPASAAAATPATASSQTGSVASAFGGTRQGCAGTASSSGASGSALVGSTASSSSGNSEETRRLAQNPKLEWRCKCGTTNRPGSYQCSKRGCRVFFCQGCGQMGHQQRFCRQGGAPEAPPSSAAGTASSAGTMAAASGSARGNTNANAPIGGGLPPPRARPRRGAAEIVAEEITGGHDEGCVICMDAPAQATLFPCRHNITCAPCTRALLQLKRPCPFCSVPIKATDLDRLPDAWRTVA